MPADDRTRKNAKGSRSNPLDNLLTRAGAESFAESLKAKSLFAGIDGRAKRQILRTAPVGVVVIAALMLMAIGILIGGHFNKSNDQPPDGRSAARIAPESLQSEQKKERTFPETELAGLPMPGANPPPHDSVEQFAKTEDQEKRVELTPIDAVVSTEPPSQRLPQEELVKRAKLSVVRVNCRNAQSTLISHGSGFFLHDDETIITNFHVIDGAHLAEVVLNDGTRLEVSGVQGLDPISDVAVLKIHRKPNWAIPHLNLGPITPPAVLSEVYVIGSPVGLDETVTQGKISNNNRQMDNGRNRIQIDASITHGSSGGPVLNADGLVVGVACSGFPGSRINFAVPVFAVASLINEKAEFKKLSDLIGEKKQILEAVLEDLDRGVVDAATATTNLNSQSKTFQSLPEYWILKGAIHSQRALGVVRTQWDEARQWWRSARNCFRRALEIDPTYSQAWYRIGTSYQEQYRRQDQYQDAVLALNAFRDGLKLNPEDCNCRRGLGISLRVTKGKDKIEGKAALHEAEALLRDCLENNPKDGLAHTALGDVLADLGDIKAGIAEYETAFRLVPDDYVCNFNYGYFLRRHQKYKDAVSAFEKSLTLAKDSKLRRESCEEELQKTRKLEAAFSPKRKSEAEVNR